MLLFLLSSGDKEDSLLICRQSTYLVFCTDWVVAVRAAVRRLNFCLAVSIILRRSFLLRVKQVAIMSLTSELRLEKAASWKSCLLGPSVFGINLFLTRALLFCLANRGHYHCNSLLAMMVVRVCIYHTTRGW